MRHSVIKQSDKISLKHSKKCYLTISRIIIKDGVIYKDIICNHTNGIQTNCEAAHTVTVITCITHAISENSGELRVRAVSPEHLLIAHIERRDSNEASDQ